MSLKSEIICALKRVTRFNTHNAETIELNAHLAQELNSLLQQVESLGEERARKQLDELTSGGYRHNVLKEIRQLLKEKVNGLTIGTPVMYYGKEYIYHGEVPSTGLLILHRLDGSFYSNQARPTKVESI